MRPVGVANPRTVQDFQQIPGTFVRGLGARSLACDGVISAVFIRDVKGSQMNADFLVIPQNPSAGLTREGDSGMVWMTNNGMAVGMHCLGDTPPNNAASSIGVGTFMNRIMQRLGANQLLY